MRKLLSLNTVYIIAAIIVAVLLVMKAFELLSFQKQGISYLAEDADGYYNTAQVIEGDYTIEIDLSDLKRNEGKVLFEDDDGNQIYVSKVVRHESNYEVLFRSSGNFGFNGATLVSAIEHLGTANNFKAEAQATYKGDTYKLNHADSPGLIHRDGDEFGFYLLPSDNTTDPNLEEKTVMELSITNLYVNTWVKKSLFERKL